MQAKKLGITILILVGVLTVSVVLVEIRVGLNTRDAGAVPLGENTLYVGGNGPNNYTHIQDAIDNAISGDMVFVYNGTYYERVVVNKTINLIGENRNTTIIDGGGIGDVIHISANWTNISGFTIRNSGNYLDDAGIDVRSDYNTIKYNIISNNSNSGITIWRSSGNNIKYNIISNNSNDGILFGYSSSYNIIKDNTISNNSNNGIYLSYSNNNTITGSIISNNSNNGIYLSYSNNNIIMGNSVLNNGLDDISLGHSSSHNTIKDNTISSHKKDGNTPSFGISALLVALGVVLWLRRRK